ncbi:hypothetical protein [Streptomyces ureilyticus]|uniref:hypothetical protein n=1 Tax=Streptomyces ureilyticus TaxID=1775131 RepID=UPI0019D1B214|nr:hypothetical protein [Streptomyces ureilyticus]
MDEIQHLLAALVLRIDHGRQHVLHWFRWRFRHKMRAQLSHYQRRGDPLPAHLRDWERAIQDPQL